MEIRSFDDIEAHRLVHFYTQVFAQSEGADAGAILGDLVRDILATTVSSDLFGFVVVDDSGEVLASILLTRVQFLDSLQAFLLSPVAVKTDWQKQGIGQQIIRYGLQQLQLLGVNLVFTYGDPNYYSKVGFRQISAQKIKPPYPLTQPEGWLGQALDHRDLASLEGKIRCVDAFADPEYW